MDGFDEHFPTGLGTWLPAPRRPHPCEILPARVAAPRDGGRSRPAPNRPHVGLPEPPPLVRSRPLVGRPTAVRAAAMAGMLTGLVVSVALAGAAGLPAAAAALAAGIVLVGAAAPSVSYRGRDALLVLVPVLGVFVLATVLWRLTALPDRPWRPRVDELAPPPPPAAPRPPDDEIEIWDR